MDTLIIKNGEKNRYMSVNVNGELILENHNGVKEQLAVGMSDDFDMYINDDGSMDIFCVLASGGLSHIKFDSGRVSVYPILENRSTESRVCCVRVIKINSRFHVFYCLDCSDRLLVHHVIDSDGYAMEPKVIARMGRRYVYDILNDESGNIHVLYTSDEGYIAYRSYVYSDKSYTSPKKIADYEARSIAVTKCKERLYAAFTAVEGGHNEVFVCNVADRRCISVSKRVNMRAEVCILPLKDRVSVGWVENGMCFTSEIGEDMSCGKITNPARSKGMIRLRVCRAKMQVSRIPVTGSGYLFQNTLCVTESIPNKNEILPKGYEVDRMAEKYMEVLGKKNEFASDFKDDLMRIEASLERLVQLAEKAIGSIEDNFGKKQDIKHNSSIEPLEEYNDVEEA